MNNKIIKKISIVLLCILSLTNFQAYAGINNLEDENYDEVYSSVSYEEGQITEEAKSALLMEPVSGTILYEKNNDFKLKDGSPPFSIKSSSSLQSASVGTLYVKFDS